MARTAEEPFDRWVAGATSLWLFLDYDGTLADFTRDPNQVEVIPSVVHLIRDLAAQPRLRVAVISGRSLKIVDQLLPVEGIFRAGVYGLELQTPAGQVSYRENLRRIRPILEGIKPRWKELIAGKSGFFLEDKGWTLAIHAEKAQRGLAQTVLGEARQAVQGKLPAGVFRWFADDVFLEIAPLLAHKGKMVEYLVHHFPLPQSRLIYIGDDDKDEEAFGTVHALGGVNILVTQRSHSVHFNEVDYVLDSPASVRTWLGHLLDSVSEKKASQV